MYCTLAQLRDFLGISGTADDALLSALITRASAAIDTYTGRTFHAALASVKHFDAIADVRGSVLYVDDDLASITSVTNGDGTTITALQYVTEPRNEPPFYALRLLGSTALSWTYDQDPENAIAITGYWAYSTTPPADVVQACVRWAGHMYRSKDAAIYDTVAAPEQGIITVPQGMPKDVILALSPYRRRIG